MKQKILIVTALAGLTLGATLAFGAATALPGDGVVASKHDMNMLGVASQDSKLRVCAFCHTPHHVVDASNVLTYNPLWSHNLNETTGFVPYQSVTFDSMIIDDPLIGPSRLCMSCHDGLIAVDQHYSEKSGAGQGLVKDGDDFGGIAIGYNSDLSNDHPIGFDLVGLGGVDGRDPGIRDILKAPTNAFVNGKPLTSLGTLMAGKSIMTCASCHEVHNKDSVEEAFLYEKQAGSAFCLMCHNK